MKRRSLSSVDRVDIYRGCSAAIRLVSKLAIEDLRLKASIIHHIYEAGHVQWIELNKLECVEFGRAFDISRSKQTA